MEKLLRPYDKEFMRMAIIKHEETFNNRAHKVLLEEKHGTPTLTSDSGPNSFSSSSTESCHMINGRPSSSMATTKRKTNTQQEMNSLVGSWDSSKSPTPRWGIKTEANQSRSRTTIETREIKSASLAFSSSKYDMS
ncbi:hypothetical protein F3Y22_tig00117012pilonHSYRG00428 [Hibiscus syriacus]|uniref:Uncharacterized protein n=1 Tax=Hibiscus syriacus TaxID=106335 RepID=A0A6A2WEZ8_HIBSY|nr:hypothetical protein F3Y22_tig00117012pilonHSYRG00428 [Hibiscus syriacus]